MLAVPYGMRIHLHPQHRTVELHGRRSVAKMLRELGVVAGTAMVIRNDVLLLEDEVLDEDDVVEVRAVISGGSA